MSLDFSYGRYYCHLCYELAYLMLEVRPRLPDTLYTLRPIGRRSCQYVQQLFECGVKLLSCLGETVRERSQIAKCLGSDMNGIIAMRI